MRACVIVLVHFVLPGVQPVKISHVNIDQVQIFLQIVVINLNSQISNGQIKKGCQK